MQCLRERALILPELRVRIHYFPLRRARARRDFAEQARARLRRDHGDAVGKLCAILIAFGDVHE